MHEAALARQILDTVLRRVSEERATRVLVVRGWVAETEAISPASVAFHFAAHARGTPAEGARLALRVVQVDARCGSCARTYTPEHHVLMCPACGSTDAELLAPTGLGIESLEVE
jgi:hydrogenase nickel incorporation protein HypA/HybF